MKACGHENITVEGCDTCYVVKLKKRVDKLLAAEYKRLDRIAKLEAALTDALDSYEEYAQYAGEFLCKKHRVAEDIAEKRALLQEDKPQ
jgi:protein gp37